MMEAGEELLVFNGIVFSGSELAYTALLSSLEGRSTAAGAWDSAGAQHTPGPAGTMHVVARNSRHIPLLFQQGC